jgi:hypothetical protein
MQKFEFVIVQGANVVTCIQETLKSIKQNFLDKPLRIQSQTMITELVMSKTTNEKGQTQAIPVITMVTLLVEDNMVKYEAAFENLLSTGEQSTKELQKLICNHDVSEQEVFVEGTSSYRVCKKCGAKVDL